MGSKNKEEALALPGKILPPAEFNSNTNVGGETISWTGDMKSTVAIQVN